MADDKPKRTLSEAMKRELDRRIADAKANPDDGVPWEEVQAATLARLRQVPNGDNRSRRPGEPER